MDIYWYGQACFKLKGKTANIIIDPYDPEFTGLKIPKDFEADIVIKTHDHKDHNNLAAVSGNPIKVEGPGEYEIKGASIVGVSVFHDNEGGAQRGKNTVYNIQLDNLNMVHLGDLGHKLSEEQVDQIGTCDILMVPVGGTFTIDATVAAEVVSQLEPQVIIPMHYSIPGLKFPLDPVENFLKEMGVENPEVLNERSSSSNKLSISKDKLPAEPQVMLLNKS